MGIPEHTDIDEHEARAFNYGVLDFAREVCTARKPQCGEPPCLYTPFSSARRA